MEHITIEAVIDYMTPKGGYGNDWRLIYVKDETKDIKIIFSGDILKKAKEGKKVLIKDAYVSRRGRELQLNAKEGNIELIE